MIDLNKQIPEHQIIDKCLDGDKEIEIDINFYNPPYEFPNNSYETIIVLRCAETNLLYGVLMYPKAIRDEQAEALILEIKENPSKFKNQCSQ